MLDYKRFISYLYTYVEGEKGVNVGYIRCEQRQGICRFTLNLQDRQGIEGGRYKVYLYKAAPDGTPIGYYLDEMMLSQGCGELRKQTPSDNVWNTDNRIEDFDGVIAVYDKEHVYASQWNEEPIQPHLFLTYNDWKNKKEAASDSTSNSHIRESEGLAFHIAELSGHKEPEKETRTEEAVLSEEYSQELTAEPEDTLPRSIAEKLWEKAAEPEDIPAASTTANIPMENLVPEQEKEDAPEKEKKKTGRKPEISELTIRLMEKSPKLPDFDNHEIYDCVRIEPNDIGLLEMENWRLGVNSFLTHGYYNYKYLMLGKLRFQDGAVKAVLGVPGVFDNKEQYIAKIFGFELFVPVKHTNVRTGNFGYWIVELV
ncbi:MAG: DUF6128 domain-containing protein [Bacteroides sp.]|nr:DUF6128 domain-containing protein [Bacteroides sp.]MCM1550742.1 DUF6128 domain-containing protein [Clostridium sp.]